MDGTLKMRGEDRMDVFFDPKHDYYSLVNFDDASDGRTWWHFRCSVKNAWRTVGHVLRTYRQSFALAGHFRPSPNSFACSLFVVILDERKEMVLT